MRPTLHYRVSAIALALLLVVATAAAQSVVNTISFNPPGVSNNMGFDYESAVVESTGLVYVGATGAYGFEIGVIDPARDSLIAVIRSPTREPLTFSRVNQRTALVYFSATDGIVAVDGRPSSPTFNQALPLISFAGQIVRAFAVDETLGRVYVTSDTPAQSRVSAIDANPASPTFHQVLAIRPLPVGAQALGIAVNSATNKIYIGAISAGNGGVYVLDGSSLSLTQIPGSAPAAEVEVNEKSNLVYAIATGNRLNIVDGQTDTAFAVIDLPGTLTVVPFEKMAINSVTARVYIQTSDSTVGKVVVIDGDRTSATFNTVLASIVDGRSPFSGDIVVDEDLNRVITTAFVDRRTFIIDGTSNSIAAIIPSTQIPSDVALDRTAHKAYVANQLNFVQKIDIMGGSLEATIVTGAETGQPIVNSNNHLLYVPRTVATTDLPFFDRNGASGSVSGLPHGSGRFLFTAINRATNRVYALNAGSDVTGNSLLPGFVATIDCNSNSVVANIPVGNQPLGIAVNETTNKVYVTNFGQGGATYPGGITVIDGATNLPTTIDTSSFGSQQSFLNLAVNLVTNKLYFTTRAGALGILDVATNVAAPLALPVGVVSLVRVNRVLNRIYLASSSGLHVLDGTTNAEIANVLVGPISLMEINETTGQVFVADPTTNRVTVVNDTNEIVSTLAVGKNPSDIAINALANRIYVGSLDDSTISVIDGASLGAVADTISVPIVPGFMAVDPLVSRLYVASGDVDTQAGVVVISDVSGTLQSLAEALRQALAGSLPSPILKEPALRGPLSGAKVASSDGILNSMLAKVSAAQAALDRGDVQAAINSLNALANEVTGQRGKAIETSTADHVLALIDAAIEGLL